MSLIVLFYQFFKIGLFGFGGGLAMLPFIFQVAEEFSGLNSQEFSNLVVLSQITPGPLAVNAATYVGYNAFGLTGAFAATFGVASPSFILILVISHAVEKFKESKLYEAIFEGIRPATVGLIAAAGMMICKSSFLNSETFDEIKKEFLKGTLDISDLNITQIFNIFECAIFIICMVLILKFKISPIKLMMVVAFGTLIVSFI